MTRGVWPEALNDGFAYRETITQRGHGVRVLDYLAGRYTHSDRQQWMAHLQARRVDVDGRPVTESWVLQNEQVLTYHRPPWTEPPVPVGVGVLYEDADVLVVDKPSGLPTLAGGGFLKHTLVGWLGQHHPGAAPVHRLGRFTSGAVVCARRSASAAHLTRQFVQRTVFKRYRAWASGHLREDEIRIETPIGPVPYAPLGTLHAASDTGRPASSTVNRVRQVEDATECDVVIHTGRPHQIRIHLASIGHPLVGDPLYGPNGLPLAGTTALPGDPGYRLHAAEVRFQHPTSGSIVDVVVEPPASFKHVA